MNCGKTYSLVSHIALITNKNLVDINIRMHLNLCDPVTNGNESGTVGYIVYKQNTLCTTEIRCCNGSKSLLSSSIPNLYIHPILG